MSVSVITRVATVLEISYGEVSEFEKKKEESKGKVREFKQAVQRYKFYHSLGLILPQHVHLFTISVENHAKLTWKIAGSYSRVFTVF